MSGRSRRSERDRRRRTLGQNFLADRRAVQQILAGLDVVPDELIVDLGAGGGALTVPLAEAGANVWAVEVDPEWSSRLRRAVDERDLGDRVRVITTDLRGLRLPKEPFRVVANPPFHLTTETLGLLLDRPARTPLTRADLVLQRAVVRKHSQQPPTSLRTAAWAPWWEFDAGRRVDRSSFRPRPTVDAAILTIRRREPPILPGWLAPRFADLLRQEWGGHTPT